MRLGGRFGTGSVAAGGLLAGYILAGWGLAACADPPSRPDFDSPVPSQQLAAVRQAVRQDDRGAVPRIVEQLLSDDAAVRMAAIDALRRLTGETHGYDPLADEAQRRAAVTRWVESLQRPAALDDPPPRSR